MTWNNLSKELKDILAVTSKDPDILRALSKDESWIVMLGVAVNEDTPIDVLRDMISDFDKDLGTNIVITCAMENIKNRER